MAQPKYLELSKEDLERVQRRRQAETAIEVPVEWRLLAEFGYYYGWGAVNAVRNNEIDIEEFNNLLSGARKVHSSKMIDLATVNYTSLVASKSKKPQNVMNGGLKHFYKDVR